MMNLKPLEAEHVVPKAPLKVTIKNGSVWLKDARGFTYATSSELGDKCFLEALAVAANAGLE